MTKLTLLTLQPKGLSLLFVLYSFTLVFCSLSSISISKRLSEDKSRSLVGAILSKVVPATFSTIASVSRMFWRSEQMSPRKSEVKPQSFARGRLINNYVSKLCEFCCRFFTEKFTYFLINSSKLIETHHQCFEFRSGNRSGLTSGTKYFGTGVHWCIILGLHVGYIYIYII